MKVHTLHDIDRKKKFILSECSHRILIHQDLLMRLTENSINTFSRTRNELALDLDLIKNKQNET